MTHSGNHSYAHEIRNILLLDDDVEFVQTIKTLLESRDFLVTVAKNGLEGLQEIMALDFDVILCDLMMEKMPGDMFYLAVERVKPALCERFVFITGYGDNPKIESFLKKTKGMTLRKPVLTEDILKAIAVTLKRQGSSGGNMA